MAEREVSVSRIIIELSEEDIDLLTAGAEVDVSPSVNVYDNLRHVVLRMENSHRGKDAVDPNRLLVNEAEKETIKFLEERIQRLRVFINRYFPKWETRAHEAYAHGFLTPNDLKLLHGLSDFTPGNRRE